MTRTHPEVAVGARPVSRAALGVVLGAALVAVLLGVLYHDTHAPGRLDVVVDPALAVEAATWRRLLWLVVIVGEPVVMVGAVGVVAAVSCRAGLRRVAAAAVAGPALAAALSEYVLKPSVGRTLRGIEAYPSGHTVTVVAVATAAALVASATRRPRSRPARVLLGVLLGGLPLAVGVSLVALGLHYTTDVIGGACVSVAAVLGVGLVLGVPDSRRGAGSARAEPGGTE